MSTNNALESFNRTWNRLCGMSPNIWKIMNIFNKVEADAHRSLLTNAMGRDGSGNSGRMADIEARQQAIKSIVENTAMLSEADYLQQLAYL